MIKHSISNQQKLHVETNTKNQFPYFFVVKNLFPELSFLPDNNHTKFINWQFFGY